MADKKKSAYGAPASDTSFRKTWDREEYAAKAKDRDDKAREAYKAKTESGGGGDGKKAYIRAATPPDAKNTESRAQRLNVSANLGKTMLVPATAAMGKKGKGAGFYCQDCDLTFKDNLQWVDHLNSRQHLVNVGQDGTVVKATPQDVRDRLAWLKRKRDEDAKGAETVVELGERLEKRKEEMEKEREERREKRREWRRNGGKVAVKKEEDSDGEEVGEEEDEAQAAMASMMGFGGFGTTKV
jgi:U4/U6.U5 tri-snRNP component SNU23